MRRLRRYRQTQATRELFAEVRLNPNDFIYPIFIVEGENFKKEISSMPGIFQMSSDVLVDEITDLVDLGLKNYILFGIPKTKDFHGKGAADPKGPVPAGSRKLKEQFGEDITLFADVCLCEYTDHGHCGIPTEKGEILNDLSLNYLAEAALAYAEAGCDWVAPSNMMDNRVAPLREILDKNDFPNVGILSYSAKFASNYYGPFRDAAESPPAFGNRKTYQIDYRNITQPLLEITSDEEQGADAVIVKPALAYLDIIVRAKYQTALPVFAYNVSGEYSMVKFGARQNLFDEEQITIENLIAIKRAGADAILTYHAADVLRKEWI